MYKSNVIAIGCFYNISKNGKKKKSEVMLGTIMTRIETNKGNIDEIVN